MANFVTTKNCNKSKKYYREKAKENWDRWRLVISDMCNISYTEAFLQMNDEEVMEANGALDIMTDQIKKEINKKKK